MMKLIFPNGEHPQVLLCNGLTRIGSMSDCDIFLRSLAMPIPDLAAEILLTPNGTQLVPRTRDLVQVNGTPVGELMSLRPGDRIVIGGIEMRLAPLVSVGADVAAPADGDMATRMVAAVPRYALRCLNGPCFGKQYLIAKPLVIGRAPECDIVVDLSEISRRHAQLRPTAGGVIVEDLGSSNGLWINDRQVVRGALQAGDELRLGTGRFVMETPGHAPPMPRRPQATPAAKRRPWGKIATVAVVAIALAFGAFVVGAIR